MILIGYGYGYSQIRITPHSQSIAGGDMAMDRLHVGLGCAEGYSKPYIAGNRLGEIFRDMPKMDRKILFSAFSIPDGKC